MSQFTVHEAKTNLSRLIAEALAGGEVVIARGNVPAVRLVPIVPRGRRHFGALHGKIAMDPRFAEPLPDDELAGWNLG
ncbi:MAG: type II toxin-antitoxin system Phd/YefM family antitoxin [Novosphingobium sp.]